MVLKNPSLPWRAEWRSAITTHMAQCVMTSGMSWRPEWSVDNWDTTELKVAQAKICIIFSKSNNCNTHTVPFSV